MAWFEAMVPVAGALAGMAIIVALWLGVERHLGQVRGGRFDVARHLADRFAFWSDYGLVEFAPDGTTLRIAGDGDERLIELAQVRALGLATADVRAGWGDEFVGGLDWLDFTGRYRDRVKWHQVVLRLDTGEQVPIFAAGQIERREMMSEGLLRATREWMQERGWVGNARREAARAHARVLAGVPALRPRA